MRCNYLFAASCCIAVACLTFVAAAPAATIDLHDGDSLYAIVQMLQPGDTVVLHAGTYGHVWMENLHGTPDAWITFRGAPGEARPVITCDGSRNVIDLNFVSYLRFQDLDILYGSDGIKFVYGSSGHHIHIENVLFRYNGNTCINASSAVEVHHLTVRNCELANSGWVFGGHGEGFYMGRHGEYTQPQVHDSLIEHNYLHDLAGSQGDGVELKHGCHRVIVQDNVISVRSKAPAITVQGSYHSDPADNNIVRRNFIWRPVDAGIQAVSGTTIENNIIVGAINRGLSIRFRDGDLVAENIRIVNNTVYQADGDAAVSLYQWNTENAGPNLVFANNAVIQDRPEKIAIRGEIGLDAGLYSSNLIHGQIQAKFQPVTIAGLNPTGPAADMFAAISIVPGQMNFFPRPGSPLLDAADPAFAPADDFSLLNRPFGAAPDVGAYEVHHSFTNPGWTPTMAYKDLDAALLPGDFNRDAAVDVIDLLTLAASWAASAGDSNFDPACDLSPNGAIDVEDLLTFAASWGMAI